MNQNDWLVGVTPVCYHDLCDNTVTLELTGQPDADYDPYAVDTSLDRPLEKLKEIADQFANNAQLVGIQCRMHWTEDTCGCLHVMVECPIAGETRASGKRMNMRILVFANFNNFFFINFRGSL